ncbi:MAG: hypothetical protein COB78_13575 [Hyphomicrobiales bacterium]|nr:MAG: hypothetical protein COB78_13575 [Hyphomicrobiales bacterium]
MLRIPFLLIALIFNAPAWAANITSTYSNLNIETDCKFYGEAVNGGTARCTGYKDYSVHFTEGDLRQMVQFGFVEKPFEQWQSFGEFNRINNVIEWRLDGGTPYATILRWFIENADPDTGSPSKAYEGQILVISTVGSDDYPESCIVGYVDARANKGANELAREIADTLAPTFKCGIDKPKYHGKKSKYAGSVN